MSKRFTDTKKWQNKWFRELSSEAKLTWIYLCDECEYYGVIKIDYGLASFQLGFAVDMGTIKSWFGDKVFFISEDKILIIQFFEFQYGDSKDTWSAKLKAREKLENMGFCIENNTLEVSFDSEFKKTDHSGVTVMDSASTVLNISKGKGIVKGNSNKEIVKIEKIEIDLGVEKVSINRTLIASWADTYPKEFLEMELKKARSWLLANAHKSPKKDYSKFLNNWFNKGWESYRKTLKSNPSNTSVDELKDLMGW